MERSLKDMTLEELWQLFPVVLSPHRPEWKFWAAEEIMALEGLLAHFSPIISHVGSTAIPGIHAKPTVDILVELPAAVSFPAVKTLMEDSGYICMSEEETRMSFNKGYTPSGYAERVFHIHFHRCGDRAEICFRDYLIAHPDLAREYEALKLSLIPAYTHNRDGYTEAKSDFVSRVLALAKS